jgi:hypothetical protein
LAYQRRLFFEDKRQVGLVLGCIPHGCRSLLIHKQAKEALSLKISVPGHTLAVGIQAAMEAEDPHYQAAARSPEVQNLAEVQPEQGNVVLGQGC